MVDAVVEEDVPLAGHEGPTDVAWRRFLRRDEEVPAGAAGPAPEAAFQKVNTARIEDADVHHVVRLALGLRLRAREVVGHLQPPDAGRHLEGQIANRKLPGSPRKRTLERQLLAHG